MKTPITILKSVPLKAWPFPITKRFALATDGTVQKVSPSLPRWFTARVETVCDIRDLARLLTAQERRKDECVIRGEPVPGLDLSQKVRRLKYADKDYSTGEVHPATFRSVARGVRWLCFDFDKLPCPAEIDPVAAPQDAWLFFSYLLPEEFHEVTFFAQWSASAGMDGWKTISGHLWFMLAEPIHDDDLREWAVASGASIDPALFNAVQIHYTAAPIFSRGVENPCKIRSGLAPGNRDTVSLNIQRRAIAA